MTLVSDRFLEKQILEKTHSEGYLIRKNWVNIQEDYTEEFEQQKRVLEKTLGMASAAKKHVDKKHEICVKNHAVAKRAFPRKLGTVRGLFPYFEVNFHGEKTALPVAKSSCSAPIIQTPVFQNGMPRKRSTSASASDQVKHASKRKGARSADTFKVEDIELLLKHLNIKSRSLNLGRKEPRKTTKEEVKKTDSKTVPIIKIARADDTRVVSRPPPLPPPTPTNSPLDEARIEDSAQIKSVRFAERCPVYYYPSFTQIKKKKKNKKSELVVRVPQPWQEKRVRYVLSYKHRQ